jgi:hypothetical protein
MTRPARTMMERTGMVFDTPHPTITIVMVMMTTAHQKGITKAKQTTVTQVVRIIRMVHPTICLNR